MTTDTDAVHDLINELSAHLSDMVGALESQATDAGEIKAALKSLTEAMASNKGAESIAAALRGLRLPAPVVNVDVNPTPIVVQPAPVHVQFQDRAGMELLSTVTYDNFDRIVDMRHRWVPVKK